MANLHAARALKRLPATVQAKLCIDQLKMLDCRRLEPMDVPSSGEAHPTADEATISNAAWMHQQIFPGGQSLWCEANRDLHQDCTHPLCSMEGPTMRDAIEGACGIWPGYPAKPDAENCCA
mmetsp:Transcript_1110/g.1911  ORF Transcript_1110/g.1911 Transcript_1110/m.1911 type:complete len:121 (+) Transcript_1110:968-1330(+)